MDKESKHTEIIKKQAEPLTTFASADLIISKLAGKDVDVDKLEKLLEIKGKFEAEENRKLFQIRFSQLQSELPVIPKDKKVMINGSVIYSYAPLEKIIEHIKPYLKKYEFSYRWSEGLSERQDYKRVFCHIMGCGHEVVNYVDVPVMSATKMTNSVQQAGSSSTYGKRYSLMGALGIMADEDNDGRTTDAKPEVNKELAVLNQQLNAKVKRLAWNDVKLDEYIKHTFGAIMTKRKLDFEQKKKLSVMLDQEIDKMIQDKDSKVWDELNNENNQEKAQ